jgi:hypothetical protein
MWEKSNSNSNDSFSIADLGMDDDVLQSLIEKDIAKDENYKLGK